MITINDCITAVKNGDYPDVPTLNEERLTIMSENLIANYSIIMANCLLNDIPSDKADAIYPERAKLYDDIMMIVTTGNFGRSRKIINGIEALCREAEDKDIWTSKKQRNNILLFASGYFAWDDTTRAQFFGFKLENDGAGLAADDATAE
jgi:hypothetical protein